MKRILQLLPCLYFCLVSAWCQAQEPIIISFPETEVQLNAEFCIDVQATNFTDITAVQFAIEWDSDFLEYKSINLNIEEEVTYLPNLKESDFSVQDNILRFVWIDFAELNQRVTLPEGSTLFQICFKAADEESSASIEFSDAIVGEGVRASDLVSVPVIGEDATIQINSEAESSNNPRLSIGSKTVNVIRQFCVPIVAKDFEQLLGLQFSLRWNAEQLAFNKVKLGNNPLGIRESNYNYSNTHFGFQWSDFNAQDVPLPEEAELFELCFEAIAEANTQATISFSDDISFEALNSNTGSFPVTLKNGTINITNETPVLDVYGAEAQPNEEVCLQVIARDMPPITGLQFELAWDKEKLQYNSIDTGEDILGLDVQTTSYAVTEDAFRLAWLEQSGQNIDLQPVQILFNLCFTALGEEGEYTVVDLGENVILEATTIFDNQPITFDVSFWGGGVAFVNNLANVYPGDTDRSREVNHYDLINIGLGYGQTGPTRENASLEYAPQPAEDWTSLTPITNVNYKHSDTNGDGKIDSEDTGAINQNWTSTPTLVNTIFTDQGVPFYVDSGVLNLLETNQLPIILGTEDRMAENIYSIAFSIYYEAEAMLEDGVIVTLENSWLGTEEELINVQRFFPEDKRIDVAISRIDQQGVTGFGELGALNIVMEDVILFQNEREVKFTIDHVQAIGEVQAESIGMSTQPSISQIQQASVATDNLLDRVIKVYPNPASTEITIATDGINVERLELHDIYGKHVSTIYKSNQLILNSFPTGIYFLTIHTNKGSTTKKINIR